MNYRHFGVMLDCSRNAVVKVEQVKRLIDLLVKMDYNCLQLYLEDTYEVAGEPYFGYMRGRYTVEEIREIDSYAAQKGVELIPCIQTLAHLPSPRKNAPYWGMFDINDILLCDDERTYEFIDRCFAAVAKAFTSRKVNIGMDEAHLLGSGKYMDKHGYTPRFEILTRHLAKVNELAQKYGFEPIMWSDMFFRPINNGGYYGRGLHIPKEVREQIPENVALAYWDYYTQDSETYDDMFTAHLETNREIWFAGGAWTWCGFAPFNRFSLWSMKPAMESVRKYGIQDVIITMWGDHGGECSFFAILPALYTIRQYADGNFDEAKIKAGFEEIFGIAYDDFCALDLPNDTGNERWNGTGWCENPCKALLFQDPFQGLWDKDLQNGTRVFSYRKHAQKLYTLSRQTGEYGYIFKALSDLCYVMDIKAELGVKTREAYANKDKAALTALAKDYAVCALRVKAFHKSFYELWHKENKAFGWEVQDIRLGGLYRRLKTCQEMLLQYLSGELACIEELEAELLPSGRTDIVENVYSNLATRGNLV